PVGAVRPRDDARREVVDAAACQRLELAAVDPKLPARDVPDVQIEEALVLTGFEGAGRRRVPERRSIEDEEVVVAGHAARFPRNLQVYSPEPAECRPA